MHWLAQISQDAGYGLRSLRRTPGFSAVAIVILGLGIGGTTMVYSVVDAVLLRPLPYPDPGRLVRIVDNVPADESRDGVPVRTSTMTQDAFLWWRDNARTLSGIAAYLTEGMSASLAGDIVRFQGARVSPSFFEVVGVAPSAGRGFQVWDDTAERVVIVSARLSSLLASGAAHAVGRTLVLDGVSHAIVGVMPAAFDFPLRQIDIWTPYVVEPDSAGRVITLDVLARVKPGVPIDAAAREANRVGNAFVGLPPPDAPDAPRLPRFEVVPMQDYLVAPVRRALRVLMAAVALLLLIVCGNMASLLMSRGSSRSRELWVRRALGADRPRLVRQLLTEGIVLALAGGAAGVAVAVAGIRAVTALAAVTRPALYGGNGTLLPGIERAGVDIGVLAFTLVVCVATGLVFSVVPALQLPSGVGRPRRARAVLTVAELALATMLMIGAGLLMHSFARLASVEQGYNPSGVLTFELILPSEPPGGGRWLTLAGELELGLGSIPGVQTAGFTAGAPLSAWQEGWGSVPRGPAPQQGAGLDPRALDVQARRVSPGYLRAIGAHLVEGRWLDSRDARMRPRSLLINRTLARQYFRNRSPIGGQVDMGGEPWVIAGVIDDVRNITLEAEPRAQAYVDFIAMDDIGREAGWGGFAPAAGTISFAARVAGEPLQVVGAVRSLVRQLDPAVTIDGAAAMESITSSALAGPRFQAVLPSLFAAVAGIVAALGIYGVLSHAVDLRRREFGIRMALGAAPGRVQRMVLREAGVLTAIGVAAGIGGAVALTRFLRTMLFGVTPLDPTTFVLVPLGFGLVAMLAALVPSWRATRVDPATVLRQE